MSENMMPQCAKCAGEMEEGFIPDHTYGTVKQLSWFRGPAIKSFWTGIRTRGMANGRIVAYRCAHCGYLELYAPELNR